MEIKGHMIALSPYRLVFFCSQILYQSIEYYRDEQPAFKQYGLRELISIFPDSLTTYFLSAMLICLCYGWGLFFLGRRVCALMDLIQYIGLPLAYLLMPPLDQGFQLGTDLYQVLVIIILTASTCAKIYFALIIYGNPHLNQQVKANAYYPIFSILRVVGLTVAKNFLTAEALIYVIVALQFLSTIYKYFHILYYNPQAEWCSTITELWGWISVAQWLFIIYDIHSSLLNLTILAIAMIAFFPTPQMLILLETKVKNVLQRTDRQRNKDYHVYLLTYYVYLFLRGQRKYLSGWSTSFKMMIHSKLSEKDRRNGIRRWIDQRKQSKRLEDKMLSQAIRQLDSSLQIKLETTTEVIDEQEDEQVDKELIKKIAKEKIIPAEKFQASFYILYVLLDSELLSSVFLYQMYYQILEVIKPKKKQIQAIEMENIFTVMRERAPALEYQGNFVEEVIQYDQLHEYLDLYVRNQKKFNCLLAEINIDVRVYRLYLDAKMKLKQQIGRSMRILEFMYPNNEGLLVKDYIIERHINNNQILSEQRLIANINRVAAQKTKIINFTNGSRINEDCVFVCPFILNRGQITHRNKKFDTVLETASMSQLKLKDIIPVFWRDCHDMKVQQINKLQQLHKHDCPQVYYVESLVSHRYLQSKQVTVTPYFELEGEMLLLVRLRIDGVKQLQIREVECSIRRSKASYSMRSNNPKSRSSISNALDVDENEKKSRVNIRFDEEVNMYDLEEKTVTIFNKQYRVEGKTNYLNINTRNLIQSGMEIKVNEDIEAVIKIVASQNDKKLAAIEKNKGINILWGITLPLVLLLTLFSALFAAGATSISTSFVSYNILISQSALMKLQYYEVSMCITSFFQIFNSFNCNIIPSSELQNYGISSLMKGDAQKFGQIYDRHVRFTKQLSKYSELLRPVFQHYEGIDMQPYKENKNILEHITTMNIMIDSVTHLIANEECANWVVHDFYDVINRQGDLLFDHDYLEYIVTVQTDKVLSNMIKESEVVFWLVEFFNVLSPLFVYFMFWRGKHKIQTILTKPLLMDYSEKKQFRSNLKCIQKYLKKEQAERDNRGDEPGAMSAETILQNPPDKDGQTMREQQSIEGEEKRKQMVGSFFNFYFVLVVLIGCHILTVMVCSKKLFVPKSEFISTLETKLNKFEQFANFNSELFVMYNDFIQLIASPHLFTQHEVTERLHRIGIVRARLNQIEIYDLVSNMLIDSSRSKEILFGDPCQYLGNCMVLNHTINAYPAELNQFFTMFYRLENVYTDHKSDTTRINQLLYETYVSVHLMAQIIFYINSINFNLLSNIITQNDVWIALSYVGYGFFILVLVVVVGRMLAAATCYGHEVLSILPSRIICRAKVLEFEVNCIYHRTNFAQNCKAP